MKVYEVHEKNISTGGDKILCRRRSKRAAENYVMLRNNANSMADRSGRRVYIKEINVATDRKDW